MYNIGSDVGKRIPLWYEPFEIRFGCVLYGRRMDQPGHRKRPGAHFV